MAMDYFEIKQFRGIRGLRMKNLGNVNLLLGNNDAGKTSVLEAIKLFESPYSIDAIVRNSRARLMNMSLSRDSYTPLESLLSLFPFDQEYKYIGLEAGIGGEDCALTVEGELDEVLRPVSEDELRGIMSYPRNKKPMTSEREVLTFYGQIQFQNELIPFEIDEFYRSRSMLTKQQVALTPIIYVAPGNHLFNRNISSVFNMSKRQEREIVDLLQLIDPEIEGFKLRPNNMTGGINQVIEHTRFGDIPLYTYGDGMKKILSLAANVRNAKDGILLIDEIETSLQASNLQYVFRWLLDACWHFNVQLFVTTHSLESISSLVRCAVWDSESELACYRLEKDMDQVYAKRFSERDLDSLVNGRGIDVR